MKVKRVKSGGSRFSKPAGSEQPFSNGLEVLWIGGQPLGAREYFGTELIDLFLERQGRCQWLRRDCRNFDAGRDGQRHEGPSQGEKGASSRPFGTNHNFRSACQ